MNFVYSLTILSFLFMTITAQAKVYVIKAGDHYSSGIHTSPYIGKSMNFTARFDQSAEYYLGNVNQYDINKLTGFSDCFSTHHKNSARFGWRWNDITLKLEIHAYVYSNGSRFHQFITNVNLNQTFSYNIIVNKTNYEFRLNGKSVTLPRGCTNKNSNGYKLYPYFGGDEVAPHDISIELN